MIDSKLLIDCLTEAVHAATEAGRWIESQNRDQLQISKKSQQGSPASQLVTHVDHGAEKILISHLQASMDQYDFGLLTEERDDNQSRHEKAYFWAVDPLDGTLPFTEGTAGYSVSIGLVDRSGQSLLGVIYDSQNQVLYTAVKGQGAFRNNIRWQFTDAEDHLEKRIRFIMDRSAARDANYQALLVKWKRFFAEQSYQIDSDWAFGGAAMNAMWVVEQAPAIYVKPPKLQPGGGSIWDFAASACIVTEAGGFVGNYHGSPLHLNSERSTFMNWQGSLIVCPPAIQGEFRTILDQTRS